MAEPRFTRLDAALLTASALTILTAVVVGVLLRASAFELAPAIEHVEATLPFSVRFYLALRALWARASPVVTRWRGGIGTECAPGKA